MFAGPANAAVAAIALAMFLGCFLIYTTLGVRLKNTHSDPFASYSDVLFQMDTPRVITDMTDFHGDHSRAKVHPLYVLFVNPFGVLLNQTAKGHTILWAIVLNAAFAAASVTLAFLLFRLLSGTTMRSLLLALIFAFSSSQMILAMVPETTTLATLSLLTTYAAFAADLYWRRLPLIAWIACGVFSFGVTTTNLAQTCICFAMARLVSPEESRGGAVLSGVLFLLGVLASAAVLACVQKAIYPSATFFFFPSTYSNNLDYASLYVLQHPLEVAVQLFKHFGLANVVAPWADPIDVHWPLTGVTFSTSWRFPAVGYAALAAWLILVVGRANRQHFRQYARFYAGLGLCVLANLVLHSLYGIGKTGECEFFLYTGNFTFAVISVCLMRHLFDASKAATVGLCTLFLLVAANNLTVVHQIIEFYDHARSLP